MIDVKIPAVGESVTEVTISQWIKGHGEYVELDEIFVELETDKATQEFPAEAAGTLKILVEEGETVEIGAVIAQIDTSANASTPIVTPVVETPSSVEPKATGEKADQIITPVGESISEVTIGTWLKQDGDFVNMDEEICEIESDKATFEFPATSSGILRIKEEEGNTVSIGAIIASIDVMEGGTPIETSTTSSSESTTSESTDGYAAGHPSPAAAKILAEKGIDATGIKGTGKDGRITKEDALAAQKPAPAAKPAAAAPSPAAPVFAGISRETTRKKLSPMRKTVARRLVAVKNETAMLTTFNEVDMKPIMDLRKKYKESFKEKYEVNLGFMSFFIKASTMALQEWPAVNAFIDGNEMVTNDFCDVSIAVSAPKGLVVPVIRNAESMSFNQIESEVVRLAKKARDNKLSMEEMQGGTFTITNGGIFGSMLSTPIINAPQSAILGMHNIVERPVAINGQVEIRPIMYLALSYDHRIIDGRESVSFLVRIKQLLEDPARLMLGI
ncbi:2-oxoglutarate dehydrogenase complex dihydrolipoyllysine-residue succinyltransferase [Reichenbachiella versicolor]|uniref:2-oxoglutarate dehydrogenase complex dihydrolipoyllysine-residue succinyltransferase n=1 Tax=Reichenbachiella versicolor TaxID=1821036 RepID=UPI000D6E9698|nr:2-oxoglutarate dehydrogenase complex dihydrolipoyllysine-residue succinyltransferase [Reichenbachiella versicolor]